MQRTANSGVILTLAAIDAAVAQQQPFGDIEDMINEQHHLSEDQKSAAWLYAWSCLGKAERRGMAAEFSEIV